jgi:hypothetical protein
MNERLNIILIRLIFKSYILHIYMNGKFQYSGSSEISAFSFVKRKNKRKEKTKQNKIVE